MDYNVTGVAVHKVGDETSESEVEEGEPTVEDGEGGWVTIRFVWR